MQNTHQYFVNGQLVYVPEEELEEFIANCEDSGFDFEEGQTFRATNGANETQEFTIPKSQVEAFNAEAAASGGRADPMTMLTMDDGERLTLRDEDVRQFVQARKTGQLMSRGLLKNTGIPDWYGKTREEREAIADRIAEMFPEEFNDAEYKAERNLGDAISEGIDAAGKWMNEGEARGDYLPTAAKGITAVAGRTAKGFLDMVAGALRAVGADEAAGLPQAFSDAMPTELPDYGDPTLNKAANVIADAGATAIKYASKPIVAVDAAQGAVNTFVDTYKKAEANGIDPQKAISLATTRSGLRIADILTDASAVRGLGKGAVKRILANTALGAGFDFAGDVVEQGAEGAVNPDLARAAEYAGEGVPMQLAMGGLGAAANRVAQVPARRAAEKARRTAQERAAEAERENVRAETRARYEANLSDEALADIDRNVNEMIEAEVIPSYRHAEEVRQRAIEKLGGREKGESAEAVQQAVMEAAQEVQQRLQTPERVTSAALERRQTEEKMRGNERMTKRGEELAEQYAAEDGRVEHAPDDAAAVEAVHAEREAEIARVFDEQYADWEARRNAAQKRGASFKESPPTREEVAAKTAEEQPAPRNDAKPAEVDRVEPDNGVSVTDNAPKPAEADTQPAPTTTTATTTTTDTDAAFRAWAVGRDGKPLTFNTEADEQMARKMFEREVAAGRVDGTTGMRVERKVEAPKVEAEPETAVEHEPARNPAAPVPKRSETRRAVIDEGRKSVMASPNAKSYNTGKVGAEKVVYTPNDGGKPFTVGRNAFEHSLRGANAEDNAIVGRHLGEALDASSPVGERSANATFRIAPVKVNGVDAHVLFTVVDGKMTEFDVLKGYNTKKNPEGMMSEVGVADAAKAFEVRADSIANLDRAWQERFKPGLVEHAKRKGGSITFTSTALAAGTESPVAESPVARPKPERVSVPKTEPQGGSPLKDAVERLRKVRADESAAPEALAEADAAVEAARSPDRPFAPPIPRPDAKSAAKVVGKFVSKDKAREALIAPYHDKENGVVVATNGRILIATKHGFDPNSDDRSFPDWKKVVPSDEHLTVRTTVNPTALANACKEAIRLARETGLKNQAKVALRIGGRIEVFDADYLGKFARAMDANGITEIRASGDGKMPQVVAKNGDTTIVLMPSRAATGKIEDVIGKPGRNYDNDSIVISGESGRVLSAPDRTDTGLLGREFIEAANADRATRIGRYVDSLKKSKTYEMISRARQRGETDAAKAYGEGWENLNAESREAYEKALRAKTDAEALNILADYADSIRVKTAGVRKDEDMHIKRAERRIAAEDALESLIMRRSDAEAYLGRKKQGAPKPTTTAPTAEVAAAQKLLKTKFFQNEQTLSAERAKLPAHATRLRAAYDVAIAEVRKREAAKTGQYGDESAGGKFHGSLDMIAEDGTVDMHRLDPALRSDPEAVEWAKKHGRTVSGGMVTPDARRAYDRERAMSAAKLAKRWLPSVKVTYYDYGDKVERGRHEIDLLDKSGRSLGWFRPDTKEVALLPGANAETVSHELMWHASRQWANEEAAKGNAQAKRLLAKMKQVEQDAPEALKNRVTRLYRAKGVKDADTLFNEWGAFDSMVNGGRELEDAMKTREGQRWFAKSMTAVKDMVKDFLTAHGHNRVDLSEIDSLDSEGLKDFMAKAFAGGKTLGRFDVKENARLSTEETAWQKLRRKHYDSVAAVRDAEREIERRKGVKIKPEDSVDQALSLRPGEHEAVTINQATQLREVKGLLKKHGISSEDLGLYMAYKAAAGRDAKIDAKRIAELEDKAVADLRAEWGYDRIVKDNTGFEKAAADARQEVRDAYESVNGSHIDPREARRMIDELENGENGLAYKYLKDKIDEIQNATMDTYVAAGLISKADAARLRAEEPDYVPFKSDFDETTGEFVGRGMNGVSKRTFHEAKGRKTAAGDILAHILNDSAMAQNKAIENKVREKLAKLVEANPELGTVEPLGNRKLDEARHNRGGADDVILFKRDGHTMAITLTGTRGQAIAAAVTGRNQVRMPGWVQKASRAWAATATELSPTFAIRNLLKDNIELGNIVFSEMGPVKGVKFAAKYAANQGKSAATLLKFVTGGEIDRSSESGRLLQQFIDDGGMIGGYGKEGYADVSKALSAEQIQREMKRGASATRAAAEHVLRSGGYLNRMSELTSRFNAYRTQVEMGMDGKEAALWSRRALTDFNRKGDYTGVTNVLRMFSNSTLGSTARSVVALGKSKYGIGVAAALMANGAAQAVIEHFANADEDEKNRKTGRGTGADVSEYDRKTSLFLFRDAGRGKIYKVGQHEGPFSLLNYAGNCMARVALGDMTAEEAAKECGLSVAEMAVALTGWGSANLNSDEKSLAGSVRALCVSTMPSVLQPLAEIGLNTDYAGRRVYAEKSAGDVKPYAARARKGTPEWAVNASKFMSDATGGSDALAGRADFPAEVVVKTAESIGKNAAKDVVTAYETGRAIIKGELGDLDPRMKPVYRDFVRDAPDSTGKYFDAKREFDRRAREIQGLELTDAEVDEYIRRYPFVKNLSRLKSISKRIDELRHYENGEVKSGRGYKKRGERDKLTKQDLEELKSRRQELQAAFLELMGEY